MRTLTRQQPSDGRAKKKHCQENGTIAGSVLDGVEKRRGTDICHDENPFS